MSFGYCSGWMHDADTGEDDIETFGGKKDNFTLSCFEGTEGELYAQYCGFNYSYNSSLSMKAGANSIIILTNDHPKTILPRTQKSPQYHPKERLLR